jgi:hypothetical protein
LDVFDLARKRFPKIPMIGVSISESEPNFKIPCNKLAMLKWAGKNLFVKLFSNTIFVEPLEISQPSL